jgi:enoyl-CoA hydratase/carnithine racemase
MSTGILTAIDGRVVRVELARPEKKNAITAEISVQLAAALAAADPQNAGAAPQSRH